MSGTWQKPVRMELAAKLTEVAGRLQAATPLLLEAHARALEGMAKVAVLRTRSATKVEAHHE
jgi:hypothetical protein